MRPAAESDGPVLTRLIRDSDAYTDRYQVMVAHQVVDDAYIRGHPVRVACEADHLESADPASRRSEGAVMRCSAWPVVAAGRTT
jgi:hypothetical protein